MKTLINLKAIEESRKFIDGIDLTEFGDLFVHVDSDNLDITIKGNFFVDGTATNLWIEDEDFIYLRVPYELIHRFITKEGN